MNTEETIRAEREAIASYLDKRIAEHRSTAVRIRGRTEDGSISPEFDTWVAHVHEVQAGELAHMAFQILLGRHVEGSE